MLFVSSLCLPVHVAAQTPDPADVCGERIFHSAHDALRGYAYFLAHPEPGMGEAETVTQTVAMAHRIAEAFHLVDGCHSLVWSIRAWRDVARVYEMAIEALGDKVRPDSDLGRELACESTIAYLEAVRGGRLLAPGGYEPDESHEALAALRARPVGDIAQCVSARRVHEPTLRAFTPADLAPLP